ncbi:MULTISPECIES: helix-turn-helix domain-containing protein [Anaerotruncus]|jgi:transcriptional regulator with XRE-family HTH domain|uniref:helix-turn-helix domain-containing protein n=1 Tax=Anaerotruncus TaxID=244127 RepID=UPI000832A129|nr:MULTISPECIES: helix-turn-helix transcriptional regulator [Anaerotruncus]
MGTIVNFGIKLKKLRTTQELSQDDLAKKLGLKRATISSYERGAMLPSVEVLRDLCNFFNVSADYLLDLSDVEHMDLDHLEDDQIVLINELAEQFNFLNRRAKGLEKP